MDNRTEEQKQPVVKDKISKVSGRPDLVYTSIKRGLYKKRIAPKGGTFLIVKIKHEKNQATYSSHHLIPVDTKPEQIEALETALINNLRSKYEI